jgi:uroporphyrinogen decarboxylase
MTSRQRFLETMRYGRPDRVPYFEEGIRDEVLEAWRRQGLPPDTDLAKMFHTDRREMIPVNLEPQPKMEKWPTSRGELVELRRRLDPNDPARFPNDWAERVKAWRTRDYVLALQLHRGFFLSMGVRDWSRFQEVLYQLSDAPTFVHEIMEIYSEFAVRLAERVLREVEIDYASFSEPIGGNDRPLLSPQTYDEFVLPSYRPALDVLRRHGVDTIMYVTYANSRVLLPNVLKAGFNCVWACEVNVEAMDYRDLRREFGRDLRLIGGIDLDTLLDDKEAIRREIEEKVPPLLAEGGYVPLADGRVRGNVPFENYAYYRRLLERVTQVSPGSGEETK